MINSNIGKLEIIYLARHLPLGEPPELLVVEDGGAADAGILALGIPAPKLDPRVFLENSVCSSGVFHWAGGLVAEVPAAWGQWWGLPSPAVRAGGCSELCLRRPSAPLFKLMNKFRKKKKK